MTRTVRGERRYVNKVLTGTVIVVGVLLGLFLLWRLAPVLLIVFSGILLAIFLDGLAMLISRITRLRRRPSLALAIALFFGFFVGASWLVGPPVGAQIGKLAQQIPGGLAHFKGFLQDTTWGRELLSWIPLSGEHLPATPDVLKGVGGFVLTAGTVVVNVVLTLFVGIYLAVHPSLYVRNGIRLFPIPRRRRMHEVVHAIGVALRWWLLGRIISMTIVGVLMAVGLWIVGVPQPLALGLIAGVLAFIPFLGPLLGAIPAFLVALAQSPVKVLFVLFVFVVVQVMESYFITPMIQQRAVYLAPALLISTQILMAVLFGWLGILLATPLTVVVIVLIQTLYIHDVLGDRMRLLGER
jgi:predicted PurR-regulated permease PerM